MIYFGDVLYNNYPNALNINWEITALCPYSCKYCDRIKDRKKIEFNDIQKTCINFKKIYGDIFYQLCITGGEPTIRNDFIDLINMFNDVFINNRIVLLTNMFFNYNLLHKKFNQIKEKNKIIYVASLHLDNVINIHNFFDKALLMNTFDFAQTEYKIIVPSWNIDKAKQAISILENEYQELIPHIRVVRNFHESFELPKEFQQYTSLDNIIVYRNDKTKEEKIMSYNDIKDLNLNKTKGIQCMLGRQNLYITITGEIYGALITPLCKNNICFGTLFEQKTFDTLTEFMNKDPIICTHDYCKKECLMVIPKMKI